MMRLLRAFRARRAALHEAERLVAGDPAGSESPGLDHLLAALRAPGTAAEMSGESAMAAAMAAEHRRAAATRKSRTPFRATAVAIVAALALLIAGGTALATQHGLFTSAPKPSPTTHAPRPTTTAATPKPTSRQTPTRTTPTPTPTPTPAPTTAPADPTTTAWCVAWWTAEEGGHPMNGRDRKDLTAAAGGADKIAAYCAYAKPTTTPTGKKSHKPKKTKAA